MWKVIEEKGREMVEKRSRKSDSCSVVGREEGRGGKGIDRKCKKEQMGRGGGIGKGMAVLVLGKEEGRGAKGIVESIKKRRKEERRGKVR